MGKYIEVDKGEFILVVQENGPTLGFSKNSGVQLIEQDGFVFKDMNKNGSLDVYEDWRYSAQERALDLVHRMSIEQIAGLMLYSNHQAVSSGDNLFATMFGGTYGGKTLKESGAKVSDLSDEQINFLKNDNLRHILLTVVDDAKTAAEWNNNLQAFVERLDFGIPVNISSDPRHSAKGKSEFDAGAGGEISRWPETLGLAATFNPELVREFGQVVSQEYRAMGITTALFPQIDIASEPRWMRFFGTFGEDTKLTTDLAESFCDGLQTTIEKNGWGNHSVNAMVKHWPGGGSGEGGRDAHYDYGKFAVYPSDNFKEHLIPFTEGAFKLKNGTQKASAVMPYYTISYGQDIVNGEDVGNSYSAYIINHLLRKQYQYDGVVCTDWKITQDTEAIDSGLTGKSWGVAHLSEAERHLKIIMAGVDQFGGNNEVGPILEAFQMGCERYGESLMRQRFEESGKRLLKNIFNPGLFENPYIDLRLPKEIVAKDKFVKLGYQAQLDSIILLKNNGNCLPLKKSMKVYVPKRRVKEHFDWFGNTIAATEFSPVSTEVFSEYFELTDNPKDADAAIVFIDSPKSYGYSKEAGYIPVSLQYRPYQAKTARKKSIASDEMGDRNYYNKWSEVENENDLDIILDTRALIGNKPLIVSVNMKNPTVMEEFEMSTDVILINFNTQPQAILDTIVGKNRPKGLLPFQLPQNMEVVESQSEDLAHDMICYKDANNHVYDFGFGMDFEGIICDERVKKYKKINNK